MKLVIQGILAIAAVVLAWLIYDSIDSKIEFRKIADSRKAVVVERLKDIRTAQFAYKNVHGKYAKSFDSLLTFIYRDSMLIVKAIGNVPDTLTEAQAVQMGIVIRDTSLIAVKDTLFTPGYPVDSLPIIPFSNGAKFRMNAGEVEKNKLYVQVFEAYAPLTDIYTGLNLTNENIKPEQKLQVGSMQDATTSGNWE